MAFSPKVYTVKRGDNLFKIAQRYNTTEDSIMALNNLTSTSLSIGQRLIIPAYTDVVVKDSGTPVYRFKSTTSPVLARFSVGASLPVLGYSDGWYKVGIFNKKIGYILAKNVTRRVFDGSKPIIHLLGFYTLEEGPALPSSYNSFFNNIDYISSTGLFMFRPNKDNPLEIEKFGKFTDQDVKTIVAIGHRKNTTVLATVHNLLYRPGGTTTSKDVVKQIVATERSRRTFINNVIKLIETYGVDGVNIDFEDAYKEDSSRISLFYSELGTALRKKGYYLSSSIPSRYTDAPVNPFSDPFNYAAIGRAVDEFGIMLYNEHGWPGSGPGPVVSIGWMEKVLKYAITRVPKEKILADVSVFGFDFNLTTGKNQYATYDMAIQLAKKYNQQIRFDQATKTPTFAYTDERGNKHEVWFEDSRSLKAKIDLAFSFGIKGVALWRLGMEDKAIWPMIKNEVVIRKG